MIAKELPEATREQRLVHRSPPAATLLDPRRDRLRVGPGPAAEIRSLPLERLIRLALARTLQDPRHLDQQVRPADRELAQLPDRGVTLGSGQLPPPGVMPRRAFQPRYEDMAASGRLSITNSSIAA